MNALVDLTPYLREAARRAAEWSPQLLAELVREIVSRVPGMDLEWDPRAGEDWASVSAGDSIVAILHARIPLALVVDGSYFRSIAALAQNAGMIVVSAPDYFDSEVFSIQADALPALRSKFDWASHKSPTRLSMHDIYFASV